MITSDDISGMLEYLRSKNYWPKEWNLSLIQYPSDTVAVHFERGCVQVSPVIVCVDHGDGEIHELPAILAEHGKGYTFRHLMTLYCDMGSAPDYLL